MNPAGIIEKKISSQNVGFRFPDGIIVFNLINGTIRRLPVISFRNVQEYAV